MVFKKTGQKFVYEVLVPKIKKNLTRRKSEFDKVVKGTDRALKELSPEQKVDIKSKGGIQKTMKKISDLIDEGEKKGLDMKEKKQDLAKGGRVGLRFGTKKKSKLQKIKDTFGPKSLGMQSVIYGLDKNPKITKADPKAKFIAAANKKKKKKVI